MTPEEIKQITEAESEAEREEADEYAELLTEYEADEYAQHEAETYAEALGYY